MKKIYLLLLFLASSCFIHAQGGGSVSGVLRDTIAGKQVSDATITILSKKDSSLVSFTSSNSGGNFQIRNLADGEYRLLITHINYHNFSQVFSIRPDARDVSVGVIAISDKSVVLQEVIVGNEAPPVSMVGDTVQYHAGAFKTPPNASVEQLLKKLPGMQVDKDGKITAQGQTVKRVLVDGKEFFGNDPKMATRNLPADAIDKVQLYDKQSDQSQLTGFDDGNGEKTINLKLKKDKKSGYFGKITAGAGTEGRKEGRFNVNAFKGARQMSVIGTGNNTNVEGFSFSDLLGLTGDLTRLSRGGSVSTDQLATMASSSSTNTGIRTIWGTGINYNNIIGARTDFTSNYFYNHYNPRTSTELQRKYLLPDSTYNYRQSGFNNTVSNSHKVNLGFDIQLDSFHSIKVNPSFGVQHTTSESQSDYVQSGSDGRVSNQGFNHYNRESDAINFSNTLLFRKKFRKKGRTFSMNMQTVLNSSEGTAVQQSVNQFFAVSGTSRRDSINQHSSDEADQRGVTLRAIYTEPLFRKSLLEFSLGKSYTRSTSTREAFDYNKGAGLYNLRNDSLSNEFENEYGFTNAGIRLRSQRNKLTYSLGISVQRAELQGRVVTGLKGTDISTRFTNLLPTARLQYVFMRNKSLTLNYATSTQQPSITQLQPVPDISNRLNIYEGNPNLKQEYIHNVSLNYSGINPFLNKNFFGFLSLNRTDNKIVNADSVFETGIKKTRPVNTNAVYNLTGDLNLGLPARFFKGSFQVGTRASYNTGKQFVNGRGNIINALTVGPRVSLNLSPTSQIDWQLSANFNYNSTTYSLQKAFNTRYFSQVYETDFDYELPASFYFSTGFIYTINNQRAEGFNASIPLWTASISKQFLKFKRGELKFRVNDILNRNEGINRTSNQSYIEDSRVNTLKRYALLSFTYSLNKLGNKAGSGGPQIIMRN